MQCARLVVPGRKTDVTDAQWLCRLAEAGLLRASLVPPAPIRALRNLTRYRKAQIRDRQREAGRLHKIMEDTGIKLDCVASDMLGMSGRAMLRALIEGTTNPNVLADLALGKLRLKLPALREALQGRFDTQHAIIVGRILAHIDYLDEAITELSTAIEEQKSDHRRRALDPRRRLAHAHHRRDLRRPRQRLLRPPRSRTDHKTARRSAREARARSHPRTGNVNGHQRGRYLNRDFSSAPRTVPLGAPEMACVRLPRLWGRSRRSV
jgi:hypothetical protein